MAYQHISVPEQGTAIGVNADFSLNVPNQPIVPYIEGDGIGVDITPAMINVIDAAVTKLTTANAALPGWKFTPGKKRPGCTAPTPICPMKPLMP